MVFSRAEDKRFFFLKRLPDVEPYDSVGGACAFLPLRLLCRSGNAVLFRTNDSVPGFRLFFGTSRSCFGGVGGFCAHKFFLGPWAGLSACVVLFLIPGPLQLWAANHWLSYHWQQQISPGASYGIAVMALAWLFMFVGCHHRSLTWILVSYAVFSVVPHYKAHIFLANVFPMGIYPALLFNKYSKYMRCIRLFSFLALLAFGMKMSEKIAMIPLVRLDGSALQQYFAFVLAGIENNFLHNFLFSKIDSIASMSNPYFTAAFMAAVLFLSTFGTAGILCFSLMWLIRKETDKSVLYFPVIIIANYLVMSLGLAFDAHGTAMRDELLHRPFVWACFVVIVWTGGAVFLFIRDWLARSGKARGIIMGAICLCFLFPAYLGREVQRGPLWGRPFINHVVPVGLVHACDFIRTHSRHDDIIQDSYGENKKAIAEALSERQGYVVKYFIGPYELASEHSSRLSEIAYVKQETVPEVVVDFFIKRHIRWFLSNPEEELPWAKALSKYCVYESRGYRVYDFQNSA